MSTPSEVAPAGTRGIAISLHPERPIPTQRASESTRDIKIRAVREGFRIYKSLKPHRACGGNLRYVHGGGCVSCIRVYARARYQQLNAVLAAEAAKLAVAQYRADVEAMRRERAAKQ